MIQKNWALIGIPDHEAVVNVGGRIGAARGPDSFRKVFKKFKGAVPVVPSLVDLGDVPHLGADVASNHLAAAGLIQTAHRQFSRTVVLGGGHDHGYSHLKGIALALSEGRASADSLKLGCINLDAHLDVRKPQPKITSGSPFYLALEDGTISGSHLVEFGIQSHCNAPELWDYARSKDVRIVRFESLRQGAAVEAFAAELHRLSELSDVVILSFDLDCAAQAFAPGVSAPQAEGFTSSELIEMMEIAGKNPKVISLGIFELNPEHDLDSRTARLAATCAYHWLSYSLQEA